MGSVDQSDLLLAERLKLLRLENKLSLDDLAEVSGVSRATLSRLENAEVSPTAQVLGKLGAVYGLTTSRLLYMAEAEVPAKIELAQQHIWLDRKTGFTRRSAIPPAQGFAGEAVICELQSNTQISYDKPPREGLEHYIILLDGQLNFTANGQTYALAKGDGLRVKLFGETMFQTPKTEGAKYVLFVV